MSYVRDRFPRMLVTFAAVLALVVSGGCGGKPDETKGAAKPGGGDSSREQRVAKERQQELELKKKVDSIEMPTELAKEWFYDGEGTLELSAQWRADDSQVRLAAAPAAVKGRPARPAPGAAAKMLVGFYVGDSPRGPFTYVDRVLGSELVLPQTFPLNDVKDRWYKAIAFDDAGSVTAHTTPVRAAVVDYRSAPAPAKKTPKPAPAKKAVPGKDAAKDAAKEEAPVAEEPPVEKPVAAILPLVNAMEKDTLERQYLGRGMCELLREFLAQAPGVVTPDAGYTDAVTARQRGSRGVLTPATMAGIGRALRADVVLTGTFEVGPDDVKMDLSFIRVSTGAVMKSKPLSKPDAQADELGRDLAAELARGLGVTLDDAAAAKLSLMWKTLNERRGYVEKAMRMHDDGNHLEALAAFEAVKAALVCDAQVLTAMAETYEDRGNFLKAAKLMVLASRTSGWRMPHDYLDRLGRMLRASRDLKGSLDVLAELRDTDADAS